MSSEPVVQHNPAERRYEIRVGGVLAVADYELEGDRMIFTHTLVPIALRGQGLAEKLVRAGLADARAQNRRVVPQCSYVAKFIERHAEYHDLLAD